MTALPMTVRRTLCLALAGLLTLSAAPLPALAKTHAKAAPSKAQSKQREKEKAEAERAKAAEKAAAPGMPGIAARAWLLMDVTSGQILASQNPDEKVEPASLTKIMTAYLAFAALRDGKLKMDQQITPSTAVSKVGKDESRMFIEPAKPVALQDLLRGLIIQSGNDAAVAVAEAVGGTESGFVGMMNKEAERLGMKNTHYMNAAGLPDPQHTTTVTDQAILAASLIKDFPQYYPFYSEKEYTYGGIRQPNRNRLLTLDPTVDGMKTGHTESAGYCLIASAHRPLALAGQPAGERRLLSVLVGAVTEAERIKESAKLLNWGYEQTEAVRLYARGQALDTVEVFKGAANSVKLGLQRDAIVSGLKGSTDRFKPVLERAAGKVIAPVAAGQQLGLLKIMDGDKVAAQYPLVALDAVPQGGIFTRGWDTVRLWFKK
ncbi:MAG: D-alanyl-D-alanine carboxypeptidase [Candidatus Protistobacter heckmanni]|nr:D-alanyl-D-alanine carboxypeptidase [Candidatus Protistobacter heckmanni]